MRVDTDDTSQPGAFQHTEEGWERMLRLCSAPGGGGDSESGNEVHGADFDACSSREVVTGTRALETLNIHP